MALETKMLITSLAKIALLEESKVMYHHIFEIANVEGVVLKTYEDAQAERELKKEEK